MNTFVSCRTRNMCDTEFTDRDLLLDEMYIKLDMLGSLVMYLFTRHVD